MWCCPVRSRWHQASSEKHLSESLETTLWKSNAAMENTSFIDDSPIHTSIYRGFLIAMFDCRKVVWYFSLQVLAANPCQQMDQNGGNHLHDKSSRWAFLDISWYFKFPPTLSGQRLQHVPTPGNVSKVWPTETLATDSQL